jgi:hypothetical protein
VNIADYKERRQEALDYTRDLIVGCDVCDCALEPTSAAKEAAVECGFTIGTLDFKEVVEWIVRQL